METEFIDWLRARLPPHPALKLGLGDDAALLSLGTATECIVTADLLADGAHFELASTAPNRIGHKALGVNLSDLAAMAAAPVGAVITLALPRPDALDLARQLYEGMLPLAERYNVALAGGDTNVWDGPLVISITALGAPHARGLLTRGGGQPGDRLLVTGALGGSFGPQADGRHLDVEPRVAEAALLHDQYTLHAGIDISDGLAIDLSRLAKESNCGAVVNLASVPVSEAARLLAAGESARSALDRALTDGEDFELLLALPPNEAQRLLAEQPLDILLSDIGCLTAEPGLWQCAAGGVRSPLVPAGFLHG